MSKFMHYAVAAAQEALDDAGWHPEEENEKEMTVLSNILRTSLQ